MATLGGVALSDENVLKFRQYNDTLGKNISTLKSKLNKVNTTLNNTVGKEFYTQYSSGSKAYKNVQQIVDLLFKLSDEYDLFIKKSDAYAESLTKALKK